MATVFGFHGRFYASEKHATFLYGSRRAVFKASGGGARIKHATRQNTHIKDKYGVHVFKIFVTPQMLAKESNKYYSTIIAYRRPTYVK